MKLKLFAMTAVLALTAAACGGGDDDTKDAPKAGGCQPVTSAGAKTVDANDELKFVPESITIAAGQAVTWKNVGSAPHTVTIQSEDCDRQLAGGASLTLPFAKAGTFAYVCTIHPGMKGTVVVT